MTPADQALDRLFAFAVRADAISLFPDLRAVRDELAALRRELAETAETASPCAWERKKGDSGAWPY